MSWLPLLFPPHARVCEDIFSPSSVLHVRALSHIAKVSWIFTESTHGTLADWGVYICNRDSGEMPGILPMKVIKIGPSTSSNRIAQACDRCRAKKIKCNGELPTCSQCRSVGFECQTSDKLSRRAFPRGYTESLEERLRALETEVRELKDLLDERDEKIELLSKIHSFTNRQSPTPPSQPPKSPSHNPRAKVESREESEEVPPASESVPAGQKDKISSSECLSTADLAGILLHCQQ